MRSKGAEFLTGLSFVHSQPHSTIWQNRFVLLCFARRADDVFLQRNSRAEQKSYLSQGVLGVRLSAHQNTRYSTERGTEEDNDDVPFQSPSWESMGPFKRREGIGIDPGASFYKCLS